MSGRPTASRMLRICASRAAASRSRVDHQRLVQRAADLPARIERRARVLIGVLQAAAHRAPLRPAPGGRSAALEPDLARGRRVDAHDGLAERGLAAAAFAHQPEVSPGIRSNETPSTALIEPMRRLKAPRTGKWTCRSTSSSSGAGETLSVMGSVGADGSSARSVPAPSCGAPAGASRHSGVARRSAGGNGSRRRRDQPRHFARNVAELAVPRPAGWPAAWRV